MNNTKICNKCQEEFTPSSRHKKCPKCRGQESKKVCPGCTGPMRAASKTCRACSKSAGSDNANWKGGKTLHQKGYLMKHISGHGYIFEHVLVMEEHLGRALLPSENVHHKNGVKNDNRIENLELWRRPQPSGARAKDLLLWAEEIIKIYKPIEDLL